MNMPFQDIVLRDGEGKRAQLCILTPEHIQNTAALQDSTAFIQQGYSIGLMSEGRCMAAVAAHRDASDAHTLWLDSIFMAEDMIDEALNVVLLRSADAIWQQQDIIDVRSVIEEEGAKDALLACGFSRLPHDQIRHADQHAWLQKGIGEHYVPRALLVIDYTYDFVARDGKLTTGEAGQAIENALVRQIQLASENGDEMIALNDVHEADDVSHPETALFPPHNIRDTEGRKLFGRVGDAFEEAKAIAEERVQEWEKTRYSAFWNTHLHDYLQSKGVKCVLLTGVCTDICVLHTAVDAYNLGYRIIIPECAVASFDAVGHEVALRHMANSMGADLIRHAYVEED